MKIKVKPKVVVKVLVIYWSCLFILWIFLKKLPEIKDISFTTHSVEFSLLENKKQIKEIKVK